MNCIVDNVVCDRVDMDGVEIDVCPRCDSVWLDGGELRRLTTLLASKKEERAAELVARWSELSDVGTTAPKDFWAEAMDRCPKDGTHMLKHYFPGTTIGLDHCPMCRGFWLDGSEFKAMLAETAPNLQQDLIARGFIQETSNFREVENDLAKLQFNVFSLLAGIPMSAAQLVFLIALLAGKYFIERDLEKGGAQGE